MIGTVVTGALLGLVAAVGLRWRSSHAEKRLTQSREQLAAILLHTEVTAAIAALDLALRDSKWLLSMSERLTLKEAWREHAETLAGLDSQQWDLLSEAMADLAPNYRLGAEPGRLELRQALTERRDLLIEAARVLEAVHGGPTATARTQQSETSPSLV
jgi:hypothetical protein